MFPKGGQTKKHCFLKVGKPSHIFERKHYFLSMFHRNAKTWRFVFWPFFPKVDKPGNIVSATKNNTWEQQNVRKLLAGYRVQRKDCCLKRDSNSHFRVSRLINMKVVLLEGISTALKGHMTRKLTVLFFSLI
jgi:hypothetical protein